MKAAYENLELLSCMIGRGKGPLRAETFLETSGRLEDIQSTGDLDAYTVVDTVVAAGTVAAAVDIAGQET